jgi:anaerobic magnesium-protoporphyrin IX monomethyl ester cyclase
MDSQKSMLGQRTLLINPPLVGGIAFTRQGRCQEREDVLGTTKPPYSLALLTALLRDRQVHVRLIDQTAEQLSTEAVIERLDREGFAPTLIVYCSSTPTLAADTQEMAKLKHRYGAPLVCFGPHASCAPQASMERSPDVDGMIVGEPEEGVLALAAVESMAYAGSIPSLTWRQNGTIVPHRARGIFTEFLNMPYPAWNLLPLDRYRLPLVDKQYVLIETSRGCPYSCDFCVVPLHQGHKFRERDPKVLVDEIARTQRELGIDYFYLWGDTVTLNVKTFSRFCDELIARDLGVRWFGNARADNLVDPAFVHRLRRSGCWMLSLGIESESDDVRKDMLKKLEREKIRVALENLRAAGIKSFAFFIYGYPGETVESMERTTRYAIELDPDFANFYPAVPYPGTELYEKCRRNGLLASEDWSRMEYSYYLLRGNGLDEQVVMQAINRATRRFFLRPGYLARHVGDLVRIGLTKQALVWHVAARLLWGTRRAPATAGASATATEPAAVRHPTQPGASNVAPP